MVTPRKKFDAVKALVLGALAALGASEGFVGAPTLLEANTIPTQKLATIGEERD